MKFKKYHRISVSIGALLLLVLRCTPSSIPISEWHAIYIPRQASSVEERAAAELQHYLLQITGRKLPVLPDTAGLDSPAVWIGNTRLVRQYKVDVSTLEEDGFELRTIGNHLIIAGGSRYGTLFGVYTLLEKYLGCRRYAADCVIIPRQSDISLPPLRDRQVPWFRYRETLMPETVDSTYALWHKLNTRYERSKRWGLWVHTFDDLVPPDKYFVEHPEYFALVNGHRVPNTQLCLSNRDVLRLAVSRLREWMAQNPEATIWSVSQNDTYGPCECDSCQALYRKYGGYSGAIIYFVNQIAERFPDKTISTLAYQYSRSAPTNIKPLPNVNIVLCTIEMNRSRPIVNDPNPESRQFCKDIRDWSRLTDNILIWDYVVQFRNYVDPFPNLRVLQPNIQFFRENRVHYLFEQGSNTSKSEFHELRTYLLAKLMWNPDCDLEQVMDDFLHGYYGDAAPFIRKYIDIMHNQLEKSGKNLLIYGNPYDGVEGYLRPDLLPIYTDLFDKAERAVAHDSTLLRRVRAARLPLEFAILELSKRNLTPELSLFQVTRDSVTVNPAMQARLTRFVKGCKEAGIERLEEYGTPPEAYRAELQRFFKNGFVLHKAFGKPVTVEEPFSDKYPVGGATALTNGLLGTNDFHCNWLGFEGTEAIATVDLGSDVEIREISARFLQDVRSWIWMPRKVCFYVSQDGKHYQLVGSVAATTDERKMEPCVERFQAAFSRTKARFIKMETKSFIHCPNWHLGAGGKAWIFLDEIVVH